MQKLLKKIFILLLMTTTVACNSIFNIDNSPKLVEQKEIDKKTYKVLMSDGETSSVQVIILSDDANDDKKVKKEEHNIVALQEKDTTDLRALKKKIKKEGDIIVAQKKHITYFESKKKRHQVLKEKIKNFIAENKRFSDAYINVTVFRNQVLLTGFLSLRELSIYIETQLLQNFPHIQLNNELIITPKTSVFDHSRDSAINALILISLKEETFFNLKNVRITTANRIVYLMGLVNKSQAKFIKETIKRSAGVKNVVDLFKYH